jgi:hypothetical protein
VAAAWRQQRQVQAAKGDVTVAVQLRYGVLPHRLCHPQAAWRIIWLLALLSTTGVGTCEGGLIIPVLSPTAASFFAATRVPIVAAAATAFEAAVAGMAAVASGEAATAGLDAVAAVEAADSVLTLTAAAA